jgi:hypothetical protein
MHLDSIFFLGKKVTFVRDSNAAYVDLGVKLRKGSAGKLKVYFSGNPPVAKKAP